jgi:hypothetical protein
MKKNTVILGIMLFIIVLLLGIQQYLIWNKPDKDDEFKETIKRLELKIDSLNNKKDSIRTVIDSTHVKIIENEKHYQERVNTIIAQPSSYSDSLTRQYIIDYAANHSYNILGTSEVE